MIDIGVLIAAGINIVTMIISSWLTWFFTRKKYNSEVDNNLIQNMKASLDFYRQLSDDNKERLEEVLKRNDKLEEEVHKLKDQIITLMTQICLDLTCKVRQRELFAPNKGNNETESKEDF